VILGVHLRDGYPEAVAAERGHQRRQPLRANGGRAAVAAYDAGLVQPRGR